MPPTYNAITHFNATIRLNATHFNATTRFNALYAIE
jgi:hypothetical protein